MSPNVMRGSEWIHGIVATVVINPNAAAAPSLYEHTHCITETITPPWMEAPLLPIPPKNYGCPN